MSWVRNMRAPDAHCKVCKGTGSLPNLAVLAGHAYVRCACTFPDRDETRGSILDKHYGLTPDEKIIERKARVCTWEGCTAIAEHQRNDKIGRQWADLCEKHEVMVAGAITGGEPARLVGCWVKAQGGAKAAARRITGGTA